MRLTARVPAWPVAHQWFLVTDSRPFHRILFSESAEDPKHQKSGHLKITQNWNSQITSSSWKPKSQSLGYTLSHCSCGIFQQLHLKQNPGSKNHPGSMRYIYWTFGDESNERKNNCFFQDFGVFGICAPLYSGCIYLVFCKMKVMLFWFMGGVAAAGNWSFPFIVA